MSANEAITPARRPPGHPAGTSKFTDPDRIAESQAERVIRAFGGPKAMAAAFAAAGIPINLSTIYKFNLPKKKGGRGGVLPSWRIADCHKAAALAGVTLSPVDLDVRRL